MSKKTDKETKDNKPKDSSKYIDLEPTTNEDAEIQEVVLNLAQRRARGRSMKRHSKKIARKREITMRRKASNEKLKARAVKKARNLIKQKMAGQKKYSELSPAQKIQVDKKLSRVAKSKIQTLAKRQLPQVRTQELERVKKMRSQNESLDLMFEEFLEENYYSGLDTKTKEKRKAHFERGAEMDDDNPSAYRPAPGDKEAKTKPSKHTKRYNRMFKENFLNEAIELMETTEGLYENEESLQKKADETGIPYKILKKVFDRGFAAWRTGHRPGTTPTQWGLARVNSFATGGKTQKTTDADLWTEYKGKKESIAFFSDTELNEMKYMSESTIIDKAIEKIHKYVSKGSNLADIAFEISRASGVDINSRELMKKYTVKYGQPTKARVNATSGNTLKKKYGFRTEAKNTPSDREEGTDSLVSIYKSGTPNQSEEYNDSEINSGYGMFEKGDRVSFFAHSMDMNMDDEIEGTIVGSTLTHLKVRSDDGKLYKVRHHDAILSEEIKLPSVKGTDRKDMPQIDGKDMQEFMQFLKKNGVGNSTNKIDPEKLKPTQGQFHKAKVQAIVDKIDAGEYTPKAILVSKDNKIIDGHHTWLAHKHLKKPMLIRKVDTSTDILMKLANDFPKSYQKKLHEELDIELIENRVCPIITQKHMKDFEKIVDRLFEKFGIDFNFTRHFRDRMSDERNNPCIDIKELAATIKKIYMKQGKSIKSVAGAEAVVKDIQSDLNIPIAVEYDSKNDEFDVVMKTIMRKKDFKTPNKIIKY